MTDTDERICDFCHKEVYGTTCGKTECQVKALQRFLRESPRQTLCAKGVPKLYSRATLGDFDDTYSTAAINRSGLLITGPSGVGKTHLGTAMFVALLPSAVCGVGGDDPGRLAMVSALWGSVPEFLAEVRGTFGQGHDAERFVISRYSCPKLLMLDDLGAEKVSDWTSQSLYLLLSRRLNDCKPTIVTSNLTLKELDATDPRLASRLGGMAEIQLAGKDRRLA